MSNKNPFLFIVPRKKEEIISKELFNEFKEECKKAISESKTFIIIQGGYGSGKTLFLNKLTESIKGEILSYLLSNDLPNQLEVIEPKKGLVVAIDSFDLITGLSHEGVDRVFQSISNLLDNKAIVIITCRKATLRFVLKQNPLLRSKLKVVNLKPLDLEDAKDLARARLNEVREIRSEALEPFNGEEIRHIWKKVNGNPRMLLLVLSSLYDEKLLLKGVNA